MCFVTLVDRGQGSVRELLSTTPRARKAKGAMVAPESFYE